MIFGLAEGLALSEEDVAERGAYKDGLPVSCAVIESQLSRIQKRPLVRCRQPESDVDGRAELMLDWRDDGPDSMAFALGLYAKWLVLVNLLMEWCDEDRDDLKALVGAKHNLHVRKLFDPHAPEKPTRRERYDPTFADRPASKRELDKVLLAILERFNAELRRQRRPELSAAEFVAYEAALQPGSAVVGLQPMRRLRDWLIHRMTPPNPAFATYGESLGEQVSTRAARLLSALNAPVDPGQRHRVVSQEFELPLPDSSMGLASALFARCQPTGDSSSFLPVVVPLGSNTTRSRVVQALYEKLLPNEEFEPLGKREVNLADDLQPLRRVLTVCRVLLIFECDDIHPSPFSNLRDFLCDTAWSELVRCLAQPVHSELLRAGNKPAMQSRIVVVANEPLAGLEPWTILKEEEALERRAAPGPASIAGRTLRALCTQLSIAGGMVPSHSIEGGARFADQVAPDLADLAGYEPVILRLVLASVNGMQRLTLQRCLKSWVQLFGWSPGWRQGAAAEDASRRRDRITKALELLDDESKITRLFDQVLRFHAGFLREDQGEQTPGLTPEIRQACLDRRPLVPGPPGAGTQEPLTIQVRSRSAAAAALAAWRGLPSAETDCASWARLNFILCDESLRQATAQMLGMGHGAPEGLHWYRRFVQAAYHGTCCAKLDVVPALHAGSPSAGPYSALAPLESSRRYRYLYSFLYRQCIEGGDWRLGRSLGRSDLRLEMLTLFAVPDKAHLVLLGGDGGDLLPPPFTPEPQLPVRDPELRSDLLEALGRAGLDLGTEQGRQVTEWVLSMLPGWRLAASQRGVSGVPESERHDINERLPRRGDAYQRAADAALKLRLDWLQSSGKQEHLVQVDALASEQLHRMRADPGTLDTLGKGVAKVLELARANTEGVTDKLSKVLDEALRALEARQSSAVECGQMADVLFRVADARATRADNTDFLALSAQGQESQAARARATQLFAESCAIYWLADRMRAAAGSTSDAGVRWPQAGARSTRYYVRVCMKLSRLLLNDDRGTPPNRAVDLAHALLDLAQHRLGLFTRHHFRFERERAAALLLQSARMRTWARVNVDQAFNGYYRTLEESHVRLDALNQQLEEAKRRHIGAHLRLRRASEEYRRRPAEWAVQRNRAQEEFDALESELNSLLARISAAEAAVGVGRGRYLATVQTQTGVLMQASELVETAEQSLSFLGFQRHHVRRLFLERAKNAAALAKLFALPVRFAPAHNEHFRRSGERSSLSEALHGLAQQHLVREHLEAARVSLTAMASASENDRFWESICSRQAFSFDAAAALTAG